MSLEATIAENTAAIRELIAKLSTGAVISQDTDTEKPAAAKANKGATVTAKKDAAQSSGATPTASDSSASSSSESKPTSEDGKPAPTYEDAKKAILTLSKEKGRQASVDALSRFGAAKLPDLDPASFGALIELVDEVLAGAEV